MDKETSDNEINGIIVIYESQDSDVEKNYGEFERLKQEKERLKRENNDLLVRAKILQERQIVYEKVIEVLWKEMERWRQIYGEQEKNFLFNFDLLKTGLKIILQETPSPPSTSSSAVTGMPNELHDKIKAWLDSHQPSSFVGTGAPIPSQDEEEILSTMYSSLQTLEETHDLSRPAQQQQPLDSGELENFISTFDTDFMDRQHFGSILLEKFYRLLFTSSSSSSSFSSSSSSLSEKSAPSSPKKTPSSINNDDDIDEDLLKILDSMDSENEFHFSQ